MRSGYVNNYEEVGHQPLRNASVNGYSRSSSAVEKATSTSAYFLSLYDSAVDPSRGPYSRRWAFPLRCLSTTAVGTAIFQITEIV